ncbi:MAG: hypothetical protein ACRBBN_21520 [Methyloligellaceae bacterium]
MRVKLCFILLVSIILSGCSAGTPIPTIGVAAKQYRVTKVKVIQGKNISYGRPSAAGEEEQKKLIDKTIITLKQGLEKAIIERNGPGRPATLKVVMTNIDLSSGVGRVLLKSDSYVGGQLMLVSARSGKIIAQRPVSVSDRSTKLQVNVNGAAIGSFFSLLSNLSQSPEDKRIASVVGPFIAETKHWMEKK